MIFTILTKNDWRTGLPKSSGTPLYSPFLIRLTYQDNAPLSSPTVPILDEDSFGQQFLREFGEVVGEPWMVTTPPGTSARKRWTHWASTGSTNCRPKRLPSRYRSGGSPGSRVSSAGGFQIESGGVALSGEMKESVTVEHEASESSVTFTIPRLIVYGMSITYQRTD